MTWQGVWTRARETAAFIRARITRRRVFAVAAVSSLIAFVTISIEALVRGRIASPLARVPTAIYTRPGGWGGEGRRAPIAIAPIGGAAAELRRPITLRDVPDHLVEAVLAVEDQRFYRHLGLDLKRIGGALVANVRAGRVTQGGSTITQQLAKNLFLTAERTPMRKLREAALAAVLEARHDKATILEAYLNEIYLGQAEGRQIHGVGAAARYYFGKDVERVGVAEAALLAGMIQAPNRFNPHRNGRLARGRRNLVLDLMVEQGRLSRATADRARRVRVGGRPAAVAAIDARHFRDLVAATLPRKLPPRGAAVYTTLDPSLQLAAERAVRDGLARLRARGAEAALVALDPRSGDILAMVGGRDYGSSQFNRATDGRRQPGSAFKPIVALAALSRETGGRPSFTLASRLEDEPLSVRTPAGRWSPTNYDRSYRGEVTLREALEQSLNVPFARLGLAIGPERVVATARRLGIASPLAAVPSLALGSSEVTLLELVRAYGVFATGGYLAATRAVLGRGPLGGDYPDGGPPELAPVVDPAEAYLVTSALEGVIARGTGRALAGRTRFESLAGKTGTSNDWRDAWFLAYTPSLVVGVWVGFDDGRSLGQSGADAALPIVARFLDRTDADDSGVSFQVPEGIEFASIGNDNGWFWGCDGREVFLEGTAPESDCRGFHLPDWLQGRGQDRDRDDDGRRERRAERLVSRLLGRLLVQPEPPEAPEPPRSRSRRLRDRSHD